MSEFKGKITGINSIKKGKTKKGDDWASLDFEVTESNPNNPTYPQIALFSYFKSGEYFKYANEFNNNFKLNDEVSVEYNFKCQIYKKTDGSGEGKFYKNDCWKVTKADVNNLDVKAYEEVGDALNEAEPDDLPF